MRLNILIPLLLALFVAAPAFGAAVPVRNIAVASDETIGTGQKNVTVAGTAEALSANQRCYRLVVQAKRTNTGRIYLGPSTVANSDTNGVLLNAGDSISVDADNLSKLFINSTVSGEGVTFIYW